MKVADLLKRADELVAHGQEVIATTYRDEYSSSVRYVDQAAMAGFRSASLSFIQRVYGEAHPHFSEFKAQTTDIFLSNATRGISILNAIRSEIAGGWLFTLKGVVAAELFSDFLEMAEHLLSAGYKDPAAVMIGSVLEEHLRQLCLKRSVNVEEDKNGRLVPRKADRLNADLAKAAIYTKLDQKVVTAWLDLRNKAAHGQYREYNQDQVRQLLQGVTEFMVRVSL